MGPGCWPRITSPFSAMTRLGQHPSHRGQVSLQKRFAQRIGVSSATLFQERPSIRFLKLGSNTGSVPDPFNPSTITEFLTRTRRKSGTIRSSIDRSKIESLGRIAGGFLGNWELAKSWQFHSGRALSINGGNNPLAVGGGDDNASYSQVYDDYADRIPGSHLNVHQGGKQHWLNEYFNTSAFTYNAPGTFGNAGRNPLYARVEPGKPEFC